MLNHNVYNTCNKNAAMAAVEDISLLHKFYSLTALHVHWFNKPTMWFLSPSEKLCDHDGAAGCSGAVGDVRTCEGDHHPHPAGRARCPYLRLPRLQGVV